MREQNRSPTAEKERPRRHLRNPLAPEHHHILDLITDVFRSTINKMASQDLQWLLVRNDSSFIVKQKGLGRIFSREPRNLVQLHSYKVRSPPTSTT